MISDAPYPPDFLDEFSVYRNEVLKPAGFDLPETARHIGTHTADTSLFGTDDLIWKFYRPGLALHARNTFKALERLRAAGLPAPAILHADVAHGSVKRFGGSCIVMERVPGAPLDPADLQRPGSPLAPALARFHGLTSDRWGSLTWVRQDQNPGQYLWQFAGRYVEGINQLLPQWDLPPLNGVVEWFQQNNPRLMPAGNPFTFMHNDLHAGNILIAGDGTVNFIDLDFAGFRSFGTDLAELLEQIRTVPPLGSTRDEALDAWEGPARPFFDDYFRACGDDRESLWREMRDVCFAHVFVRGLWQCLEYETRRRAEGTAVGPEVAEDLLARRSVVETVTGS